MRLKNRKSQPVFGYFQRDGQNKNGMTMFKCLLCGRRSSWKNRDHGHSKLMAEAKKLMDGEEEKKEVEA